MNDSSRTLSIIAYYLSEYSKVALDELGYKSYSEAFKKISVLFGKDNNFLKLRRDEFDALPNSSSPRLGWRNRPPAKGVIEVANDMQNFSFEQLTQFVKMLIYNAEVKSNNETDGLVFTNPQDVERLINTDDTAQIKPITGDKKIRIYDTRIIHELKSAYSYRCQICGCKIGATYDSNLIHAHHIDYFSKSFNNNASNIMIVCPNHHGIIHDKNPVFNFQNLTYTYPNGLIEGLKLNIHIGYV